MSYKPFLHVAGEPDNWVVPAKDSNNGPLGSAEGLEGSRLIEENTGEPGTSRRQSREIVSPGLKRVREAAGRFAAEDRKRDGKRKPESFDFLGFTHICSTIHQTGRFTVKRKTIGKRMAAKRKDIKAQLRRRMHESVAEQGTWLGSVVRGYFNYHTIPGNFPRLRSFHQDVV